MVEALIIIYFIINLLIFADATASLDWKYYTKIDRFFITLVLLLVGLTLAIINAIFRE